MKRIAITGSSGYLGTLLREFWSGKGHDVLGIDVKAPSREFGEGFARIDIADPASIGILDEFRPDTLVHAAFALRPIHDSRETERINLEGSRNLLNAAAAVLPDRLMFISSATAYGASPEYAVPMREDHPLKATPAFPYAHHKGEVESLFADFAERHPEIAVSRVRPAIVSGPGMDNFLSQFFFGMRCLVKLDGHDQPFQFVHERDAVGAIDAILAVGGRGPFNVAPPDVVTISEIAEIAGRPVIPFPLGLARLLYRIGWNLGLPSPKAPPGFVEFGRYPWLVDSERLMNEIGYAFLHSSTEALEAAAAPA